MCIAIQNIEIISRVMGNSKTLYSIDEAVLPIIAQIETNIRFPTILMHGYKNSSENEKIDFGNKVLCL